MADFIVEPHAVAPDTSDSGPALCQFGRTGQSRLCIAWTGENNHWVNIMPLGVGGDGQVWFDTDNKVILPHQAGGGVALAQSENWREGAAAWAVENPQGELDGIIGATFDGDLGTVRELVSFEWSDHTPALALFNKELNVAWTGSNNKQLNCAPLVFSDDGGWVFSSERKSISAETSPWEPALAWRVAPNELFIGWTGEDNALNVMHCPGGGWDDPAPYRTEFDGATRRTFPGETSDGGPALAFLGPALLMAYRGSGNENLNLIAIDLADYSISWKRTSAQTTAYQPALCRFGDHTYIAWTGEDAHLNVGIVAVP
jgi:hypothetical protein